MAIVSRKMAPLARGLGRALLLAAALLAPGTASADEASAWVGGLHSRVRLLAGGLDQGRPLAGVEIALDRGFKTYWRNPGDAGLPPAFDWSASDNVASVDVKWPAPSRTEDAGGVSFTYAERVTLPLVVTPRDPKRPIRLDVALDYGVCKDICIPAHATLSLALPEKAGAHPAIEAALAQVPSPQPLGASGDLAILSADTKNGDKPKIAVVVRRPPGTRPVLFPEAPDNWFLSTPAEGEEVAPDQTRFLLKVEERPKDHGGPVPIRLTLVAGGRSIETDLTLDLARKP
jgi:DsbC/DsbD-like thiol-disulfide interchange protein